MLNVPVFLDRAWRLFFGTHPAAAAPVALQRAAPPQAGDDSDPARWAALERAHFVYTGAAAGQPLPAVLTPTYARTRAGHRARLLTVPGTDIEALVAPDYANGRPRVLAVFSHRQWVSRDQIQVEAA